MNGKVSVKNNPQTEFSSKNILLRLSSSPRREALPSHSFGDSGSILNLGYGMCRVFEVRSVSVQVSSGFPSYILSINVCMVSHVFLGKALASQQDKALTEHE